MELFINIRFVKPGRGGDGGDGGVGGDGGDVPKKKVHITPIFWPQVCF